MALKTSLRPIARKIAEAVGSYATSQGWAKDDYALVGTWDEKTDRIRLVLGTDRHIDERQWYSGIVQAFRRSFSDSPWITRNIGLVVENVQNLDQVYLHFPSDDDEVDLTDMLEARDQVKTMDYEIIIGLEIHVQLQTESKMFSWSGTDFGLPPNTQTDPVSLGLPGTLPVMNRKAFDLALKTAVALHAEITPFTKWDRKNYYYPDLPKNYQISQYDLPFLRGGHLEIPVRKDGGGGGRCHLTRIHLEEDTGKLTHGDQGFSEVDLNRAGIPLLEIVTEPEIRSPADARGCLEELRLTLRYLEVSDCEMQEGSLRCDANVNLHIHKDGKKIATPIVEIKNLNSFRSVEKALIHEAQRQHAKWLEDGKTIHDAPKTTRGWNDVDEVTKPQREKETAADYRYFPEPDLIPVVVDRVWLERIGASIGELPAPRRQRFETDYGLSPYDANVLVEQGQDVADYYDAVAKTTSEFKLASNWIQQDVLRTIKEKKLAVAEFPVRPDQLAGLINRVKAGELNTNQGREILGKMIESGEAAETIISSGGYQMVSDRDAIATAVAAAIAANPQAVEDLKKGKKKPEAVKGFLRGQVMKQTGGKANPALVGELLESKLAELLTVNE